MIWEVRLEDQIFNDLKLEDEEVLEMVRAEFNAQREEAVRAVNSARRQVRSQWPQETKP